jgi:hypothetical protein
MHPSSSLHCDRPYLIRISGVVVAGFACLSPLEEHYGAGQAQQVAQPQHEQRPLVPHTDKALKRGRGEASSGGLSRHLSGGLRLQ